MIGSQKENIEKRILVVFHGKVVNFFINLSCYFF